MKRSSLVALAASFFTIAILTIGCSTTPTTAKTSQAAEIAPCAPDTKPVQTDTTQKAQEPTPAKVYEPGHEIAIVSVNAANVRDGSSLSSPVLFQATKNDLLLLDGGHQGGPWYRIIEARTGQKGWVRGDMIRLFSDQSLVAEDDSSTTDDEVASEPSQTPESRSYSAATPLPSPAISETTRERRFDTSTFNNSETTPQQSISVPQRTYSAPSYPYSYPSVPSSPPATGSGPSTVWVQGYTRRDGAYVAPHARTAPNSTKLDNWSTKGNVNPYTGKRGSKSPF